MLPLSKHFLPLLHIPFYKGNFGLLNQWSKELVVASFPGPAQLSVAYSTVLAVSDGKLGGAWERG